jgi:hypothetical protein
MTLVELQGARDEVKIAVVVVEEEGKPFPVQHLSLLAVEEEGAFDVDYLLLQMFFSHAYCFALYPVHSLFRR